MRLLNLLNSILFSTIFFLPFSVTAQHSHDHDGGAHDHHDDEHGEETDDNTEPDISLDLRLLTSQQLEVGIQTAGLNLTLDLGDTSLSIFGGLGAAREGQLTTGLTFTQAIELGWNPTEKFGTYLSGVYHAGPLEETNASAGVLEGGLTIRPVSILDLSFNGGIRGLAVKVDPNAPAEETEKEEGHHAPFLLPAIHGGHPEHAEEGPAEWFISAEMRINLWRKRRGD